MIASYQVQATKLLPYLLNPTHIDGGPKAALFMKFGFVGSGDGATALAMALLNHPQQAPSLSRVAGRYGPKLIAEGPLETPSGETPHCRSVWAHDEADETYRLITAYIREP